MSPTTHAAAKGPFPAGQGRNTRSGAAHWISERAGLLAGFMATLVAALLLVQPATAATGNAAESAWPQFRGPDGLAVAGAEANPPIHFGPGSNVVWKTGVPAGHSSPCIWGGKIFLTAFEPGKLETLCVDRSNGHILWRREAPVEKIEPTHRIGSPAASTPATDGQRVYVYFGSAGLLAYDFDGREKWRFPLPAPMVEFGTGTSPIVAGNFVILVCDQDQGSFLLALDRETGKQIWRTERGEFRRSFATPFVWRHDADDELVVPGSIWLRSYNLKDGSERWSFAGTSRVANSSPTCGDGLLFSASWNIGSDPGDRVSMEPFESFAASHDQNKDSKLTRDEIPAGPIRDRFSQMDLNKDRVVTATEWQLMAEMFAKAGNAVLAIRPGGRGDITATHLSWKAIRSLPYVCSPVYFQGRLYTLKNGGLASCYDAKTGKVFYQDERIGAGGDYYASLVAAGGRIYAISQKGVVVVWASGESLNILARNDLGEDVMATPAVIGNMLYVRTSDHLYAFGGQQQ
jgi:outer membrane protein assembly factor BamB